MSFCLTTADGKYLGDFASHGGVSEMHSLGEMPALSEFLAHGIANDALKKRVIAETKGTQIEHVGKIMAQTDEDEDVILSDGIEEMDDAPVESKSLGGLDYYLGDLEAQFAKEFHGDLQPLATAIEITLGGYNEADQRARLIALRAHLPVLLKDFQEHGTSSIVLAKAITKALTESWKAAESSRK